MNVPPNMRAVVLGTETGDAPLSARVVAAPGARPGWVTVRLRSAALNRLDSMILAARTAEAPGTILGSDGAGVVAAIGAGVGDRVRIGDDVVILPSLHWGDSAAAPASAFEILGSPTHGTHAEYVTVPAENVLPRPSHLSWDQAAALPLAALTAWRALMTRGRLASGETVVIGAASSGVGTMAIQIAVASGARVLAVTAGERKSAAALRAGADAVIDRSAHDIAERVVDLTGGVGADLALDPTGALWQAFVDGSRPGGRIVAVGRAASPVAALRVQSVYWKQVDVLGSSMGSPADFAALLDHIAVHRWAPVIDSVHPLSEIVAEYERLESPERIGKVVLAVSE